MMNLISLSVQAEQPLFTPRLTLVPQTRGHAEALFPILENPLLHRYTGNNPPSSEQQLFQWFTNLESRQSPKGDQLWFNWVLMTDTDTPIGYVQATLSQPKNKRKPLGYLAWVIGVDWQQRGYATEAMQCVVGWLDSLGFCHLQASIHPNNVGSQGVARNLNMVLTSEVIDGEQVWTLDTAARVEPLHQH